MPQVSQQILIINAHKLSKERFASNLIMSTGFSEGQFLEYGPTNIIISVQNPFR